MPHVLSPMRLMALVFAVILGAAPASAQQPASSPAAPDASSHQDDAASLPVSLDKIRGALTRSPVEPLRGLDDKPHFTVEIREKQKITLDDLIRSMDFKSGPPAPGGLYAYEQNRLAVPSVDNPLRQPYAAFSQPELLTIVIENLAGKYLGGRALNAVSGAERSRAEQAARDEVQKALADFFAAQKSTAPPTTPKD